MNYFWYEFLDASSLKVELRNKAAGLAMLIYKIISLKVECNGGYSSDTKVPENQFFSFFSL